MKRVESFIVILWVFSTVFVYELGTHVIFLFRDEPFLCLLYCYISIVDIAVLSMYIVHCAGMCFIFNRPEDLLLWIDRCYEFSEFFLPLFIFA